MIPFAPTHPGDILKEELQARGISQKRFAQMIEMSYTAFNEILNGKRPISVETAMKIEAATEIDARFWIDLQSDYNYHIARKDGRLTLCLQKIRSVAAML